MTREGFMFDNAEEAMKFYERCEEVGALTMEERIKVLRQMVKEKIGVTYLRDVESHARGKKVLKIGYKRKKRNV